MAALSEWLQIMLAEIARKRDDLERAREEDVKRTTEKSSDTAERTGSTAAALRTNAAPPT
jgi:ribosomal protein S12 methylthiotransferase accessory factor YcaO